MSAPIYKEIKVKRRWSIDHTCKCDNTCNKRKIKRMFVESSDMKHEKHIFWKPVFDNASGKIYYWNWKTNHTSWYLPISPTFNTNGSQSFVENLQTNRLFVKKKFDQAIEYNIETIA